MLTVEEQDRPKYLRRCVKVNIFMHDRTSSTSNILHHVLQHCPSLNHPREFISPRKLSLRTRGRFSDNPLIKQRPMFDEFKSRGITTGAEGNALIEALAARHARVQPRVSTPFQPSGLSRHEERSVSVGNPSEAFEHDPDDTFVSIPNRDTPFPRAAPVFILEAV